MPSITLLKVPLMSHSPVMLLCLAPGFACIGIRMEPSFFLESKPEAGDESTSRGELLVPYVYREEQSSLGGVRVIYIPHFGPST